MKTIHFEAPFTIRRPGEQINVQCQVVCGPGDDPQIPLVMDITSEEDRLIYYKAFFTTEGLQAMYTRLRIAEMSPELFQDHLVEMFTTDLENRHFLIAPDQDTSKDMFTIVDRITGRSVQLLSRVLYPVECMDADFVQRYLAGLLDKTLQDLSKSKQALVQTKQDADGQLQQSQAQAHEAKQALQALQESSQKKIDDLQTRLAHQTEECRTLTQKLTLTQNEELHAKEAGSRLDQDLQKLQRELAQTRQQRQALQESLSEVQTSLKLTQAQSKGQEDELVRVQALLGQTQAQLQREQQARREAEVRLESSQAQLQQASSRLQALQADHVALQQASAASDKTLQLQLQEQRQEAAQLRAAAQELRQFLAEEKKRNTALQEISASALQKAEAYGEQVTALQTDLQVTQDELSVQQKQTEGLKAKLQEADDGRIQAETKLKVAEADLREALGRATQAEAMLGDRMYRGVQRGELRDLSQLACSAPRKPAAPDAPRPRAAPVSSGVKDSVLSEYAHLFRDSVAGSAAQVSRPASQAESLRLETKAGSDVISLAKFLQPRKPKAEEPARKEKPDREESQSISHDTKQVISQYMRGQNQLDKIVGFSSTSVSSDVIFDQIRVVDTASRLQETDKALYVPFSRSPKEQVPKASIVDKYQRLEQMGLDDFDQ